MATQGSGSVLNLGRVAKTGHKSADAEVTKYTDMFKGGEESEEMRKKREAVCNSDEGKDIVDQYYNVATDFYEYGWGASFHFAKTFHDSNYEADIRTHEFFLPYRMKVSPGDHIVDMGCGVGGPARNIARFSGCKVTGVTINEYQVQRANAHTKKMGLENQVNVVQGDFMKMPFSGGSLDGAFAIEATCHTTDKIGVFGEAYRCIKPGAYFAGYEWVTTDKYDHSNKEHRDIIFGIEKGNGLPPSVPWTTIDKALADVGFEVVEAYDAAERCDYPWYTPLAASYSWKGWRHTQLGAWLTHIFCWTLETLRIAPKGTTAVSSVLMGASRNLTAGGRLGIYTTMYFFLARKPLDAK